MPLSTNANMKNVSTQMVRVDTDVQSSVWIGGGKSDARKIVGEEFADITGGSRINFEGRSGNELVDLLSALVESKGNEAPGLEGVTLVSLTSDSFVIMYEGWMGSKNYIEFTGSAAEEAINSALFTVNGNPGLDLKNSASQFTIFDSDEVSSIFVGSNSATSDDVKVLTGGSRLDMDEAEDLLIAATSGRAKNDTDGIDGARVIGLTDEGFTLQIEGGGATVDTIVFTGSGAEAALLAADAASNVDVKDANSGFDIFDVAAESNEFVGGTSPGNIGEQLDGIIGGSSISRGEVLELFDDLITGNARRGDTGIDNVELVGMNETSFSISFGSAGGNTEYLLFTNVHTLEGADAFGFVDNLLT